MSKQTPAAKRSTLIDLLWKFKHRVRARENIDFSSLVANPVYRRAVLERYRNSGSARLASLTQEIGELDPGVDLSTDSTLAAFSQLRRRADTRKSTRTRYYIGAGLMLIAVTVLLGMIAIKLISDDASHLRTSSRQIHHAVGTTLTQHSRIARPR